MGWVFFGWGILVTVRRVRRTMKSRFGTARSLYVALGGMVVVSLVIGIWPGQWLVIAAVTSGVFVGLNNTLVIAAVMSIAPVPRPVASATYGFVRFIGGGLAPFVAGKIVEHTRRQPAPAVPAGRGHRVRRRARP